MKPGDILSDWNECAPYGEQMKALKLAPVFHQLVQRWRDMTVDEIEEAIDGCELGQAFYEAFSTIFCEGSRYTLGKIEDKAYDWVFQWSRVIAGDTYRKLGSTDRAILDGIFNELRVLSESNSVLNQ